MHSLIINSSLVTAESDFVTFLHIKNHFKTDYGIATNLFTVQSRSEALSRMYEGAARTPVNAMDELDELMGIRGRRSSDAFFCTPILERTRKRMKGNIDIEIETRMVSRKCQCLCLTDGVMLQRAGNSLKYVIFITFSPPI